MNFKVCNPIFAPIDIGRSCGFSCRAIEASSCFERCRPVPIPDRPQLLAGAVLLLTAAFIASRWIKPPFGVWWRRVVVVGYLVALAVVLVWIAVWLSGSSNPN